MTTSIKKLLLISITLFLGVMSSGVMAETVTYMGGNEYAYYNGTSTTDYTLSAIYDSYDNQSTLLQNQVWWGSQSTANLFATAAIGNNGLLYSSFAYSASWHGDGGEDPFQYVANIAQTMSNYVNDGALLSSSLPYPGYVIATQVGGAPEIDGSLAPKVGFLLGCLFLMFGRKKQNSESMMIV